VGIDWKASAADYPFDRRHLPIIRMLFYLAGTANSQASKANRITAATRENSVCSG